MRYQANNSKDWGQPERAAMGERVNDKQWELQQRIGGLPDAGADGLSAPSPLPNGGRPMRFTYPSGSRPLDGYTIKRGIGVGGFGEVYFAVSDAGKEVALKRIQRNLDIELRGVRQCLNMKHVNLISLWDIRGNEQGESWVVMEYVPGQSLRDVLEQHPQGLPDDQVKTWFTSIAAGVSHLHDHGIVHRDLKPGNVFYDVDEQVVKIGDYGLSKFISCSRRSGQTESVGTFHYMAPEIGRGVYGKEIDIYAMGVILFELLSGDLPFDGESSQEIMMKHLTADPNLSKIPAPFQTVIERSLFKDPELRYSNVMEMCADLPWEDVASSSQQIGRRHSIGPIRSRAASSPDGDTRAGTGNTPNLPSAAAPSAAAPIADVTYNAPIHPNTTPAAQAPKMAPFVIDEEVANHAAKNFALMQQRVQGTSVASGSGGRVPVINPAEIVFAESPSGMLKNVPNEPIARAVHQGVVELGQWWRGLDWSTPWKVAVLVVATLVLVLNSTWLLPISLVLGLVYLIYFSIRSFFVPADHEWRPLAQPNSGGLGTAPVATLTSTWPGNPGGAASTARWNTAPMSSWLEQLQAWLTSCFVAAIACGLFSLLGLMIRGDATQLNFETLAGFVWTVGVSTIASWSILGLGKLWEYREGDRLFRRFVSLGTGVAIGIVAFGLAKGLMIENSLLSSSRPNPLLAITSEEIGSTSSFWQSAINFPALSSFMISYSLLFAALRWWKLAAPDRRARISIFRSGLCLVAAAICSEIFEMNSVSMVVVAGVTCLAVQLAAPNGLVSVPSAELVSAQRTHYRPQPLQGRAN